MKPCFGQQVGFSTFFSDSISLFCIRRASSILFHHLSRGTVLLTPCDHLAFVSATHISQLFRLAFFPFKYSVFYSYVHTGAFLL